MKETVRMLLASALCILGYVAAVAIKRQLLPSAFVLAESALLLLVFALIAAVVLVILWRKRTLTAGTSVAVFVILLLGAACFNLTVPGVFDRSFSLHLLSAFDQSANGMTETEMQDEFRRFGNYAVRKRLREQLQGGMLQGDGDRYHITASGRAVVATARLLGGLYELDPRIVDRRGDPDRSALEGVPSGSRGGARQSRTGHERRRH